MAAVFTKPTPGDSLPEPYLPQADAVVQGFLRVKTTKPTIHFPAYAPVTTTVES